VNEYQRVFLHYLINIGVLKFGDFQLKSGRQSPYFINTGLFNTGLRLMHLAGAYVNCILNNNINFDVLYGPAYKGIPLVSAISMMFLIKHEREVPYAFNRKEYEDRKKNEVIIGHPLYGNVLIIDDVITAGTSIKQSEKIITDNGAKPIGAVTMLDRQEVGTANVSATEEIEHLLNIQVFSIVTFQQLVDCLDEFTMDKNIIKSMTDYRNMYGVK
jgi:orotate phosphoribosyltransferase